MHAWANAGAPLASAKVPHAPANVATLPAPFVDAHASEFASAPLDLAKNPAAAVRAATHHVQVKND